LNKLDIHLNNWYTFFIFLFGTEGSSQMAIISEAVICY
jgi:hypothetical protein